MSIQTGFSGSQATRLLSKHGQQMFLRAVPTDQVFDPVAGTVTEAQAAVDTAFNGYPYPVDVKYTQSVGASLVKEGDMLVLCPPVREPINSDKVVVNGDVYSIINIQPVLDGGLVKLYMLHIRK